MKSYACLFIFLLSIPLCIADTTRGGAGMLALGDYPDIPGIEITTGTSVHILTIFNGGIHINSSHYDALKIRPSSAIIETEYIDIVGDAERYDPPEELAIHTNLGSEALLPDPYEYMPDAVYDPGNDLGTISAPGTYTPGYYSGGIQIDIGNIILEPGDYYLDSIGERASMEMHGGILIGDGVTLHIVGNGDHGVDIAADVDISAPISGPYEGIAIFQSRNPDGDGDALNNPESEFVSLGTIEIHGTIYMPYNFLTISGNSHFITTEVIADRIEIGGLPEIVIDYHGDRSILGDFVDPGGVDLNDLLYFVEYWQIDYDVQADLNYDHRVDLADFAIIAENWTAH